MTPCCVKPDPDLEAARVRIAALEAKLVKVGEERRDEWIRAERAEADAVMLRQAAKRCYPTLHSHMIHCQTVVLNGDCTCGKRDADVMLGTLLNLPNPGRRLIDELEQLRSIADDAEAIAHGFDETCGKFPALEKKLKALRGES